MSSKLEPTPLDRLAASRQAILKYMTAGEETPARQRRQASADAAHHSDTPEPARGGWRSIRHAVRVWWHRHPAQLALDVAKPVLGKYAEEKPYQLLGIAAVAGAAVVLTRPWRLVSLTGLAVTALKSSHVSGLLLSLLSTHFEPSTNENQN